jgi:hypothetical protein
MAARGWKKDRASERIDARINELPLNKIEIKKFVKETSLTDLPRNVAYRIDGAHFAVLGMIRIPKTRRVCVFADGC